MVAREDALAGSRAHFRSRSEVIRALTRYGDEAGPRTGSVMIIDGAPARSREPFHPGVIAGLEERAELGRRLRRLSDRDRLLVFLWYVEGWPAPMIAARLGISRVHCYRVRDRSLGAMLDEAGSNESSSASTSTGS